MCSSEHPRRHSGPSCRRRRQVSRTVWSVGRRPSEQRRRGHGCNAHCPLHVLTTCAGAARRGCGHTGIVRRQSDLVRKGRAADRLVNDASIAHRARNRCSGADPRLRLAVCNRRKWQSSKHGCIAGLPATTTTYPTPTTETTIVALTGPRGVVHRTTLELVVVPNVVGMTLEQADPALSAAGLSAGEATTSTSTPSGQSPTGTILAQEPAPGSQVSLDTVVQLNISGY
jgi:hypothetical protein